MHLCHNGCTFYSWILIKTLEPLYIDSSQCVSKKIADNEYNKTVQRIYIYLYKSIFSMGGDGRILHQRFLAKENITAIDAPSANITAGSNVSLEIPGMKLLDCLGLERVFLLNLF